MWQNLRHLVLPQKEDVYNNKYMIKKKLKGKSNQNWLSEMWSNVVSPDDGKHWVEVLALAAVQGDLDEVLDGLHALELVGLPRHLCGHPEGLVIDGLLKALQASWACLGAQLEQVIYIFSGFDGTEKFKGPHWELSSHLHRTEL